MGFRYTYLFAAGFCLLVASACGAFTPTKVRLVSPKAIPDGVTVSVVAEVTGRLDASDVSLGQIHAELVDRDPFWDDPLSVASVSVVGAAGSAVSLRFEFKLWSEYGRIAGQLGSSYQPSAELAVRFRPSTKAWGDAFDAEAGVPGAPLVVSTAQQVGPGPFADPGPPLLGIAGGPVVLDARDSTAPNASITGFLVDWGDGLFYSESLVGAPDGSFDLQAPHIYQKPGEYTARIIVVSSKGGFDYAFLPVRVQAGPEARISVPSVEVRPGKAAVLDVIADTDVNVAALNITLTFDHSLPPGAPLMRFISTSEVKIGSLLQGALLAINGDEPGRVVISAVMATARRGSGLLARIPLAVPTQAAPGIVYPIGLEVSIADDTGRKQPVLVEAGRVVVREARRRGDVNDDGVVTVEDARLALGAAAKKITLSTEDFAAADVDGNGVVSVADVVAILRLSVGLSA